MKSLVQYLVIIGILSGCGGSGGSGNVSPAMIVPVVTPDLVEVPVAGISVELGNFDPAPTVDGSGGFWMSYSHVSLDGSGISLVEIRLASSPDAAGLA